MSFAQVTCVFYVTSSFLKYRPSCCLYFNWIHWLFYWSRLVSVLVLVCSYHIVLQGLVSSGSVMWCKEWM